MPYHLARYARTKGLGHLYWEMSADRFVPGARWAIVTDLRSRGELTELDELINQEILLERARKLGVEATDGEVEDKFTERKSPFTEEEFQRQLKENGVTVDDRLRTSNPRIYAAGDVASPYKFTHAADAQARLAIQNALFLGRKRASALVIPWCTYTDPEIAHVGLYEAEAHERGLQVEVHTVELRDVDRARLDGETEGYVRVFAQRGSGRILGATIVARHAGEMIGELSLAMTAGVPLSTLSRTIHPYPTQAEAIKRAGDLHLRGQLTPRVLGLLRRWLRWLRR